MMAFGRSEGVEKRNECRCRRQLSNISLSDEQKYGSGKDMFFEAFRKSEGYTKEVVDL